MGWMDFLYIQNLSKFIKNVRKLDTQSSITDQGKQNQISHLSLIWEYQTDLKLSNILKM